MVGPLDLGDPEVIRALHALQRAAYRVEATLIGAPIPVLDESPAEVRDAGIVYLGTWDGGRLRGAIGYRREGDVVDIHRLVVDPPRHRRGIATQLLAALRDREADALVTVVSAAARNRPAVALYEHHGFRVAGERVVAGGVRILDLRRP